MSALTKKQTEALALLTNTLHDIYLLFGGSRSGKKFLISYILILRALKHRSRHLIIGEGAIAEVCKLFFTDCGVTFNKSHKIFRFPNGSEICIGLNDRVFGQDYSTIYINDCSQLDYITFQSISIKCCEESELKNTIYMDEVPEFKKSWSYQMVIKGVDPLTGEDLSEELKSSMVSFQMNPVDNQGNIEPGYIEKLESLPEYQKNRFLLGVYSDEPEYSDHEGEEPAVSFNIDVPELTVKYLRELLIGIPDDTPVSLYQNDSHIVEAYCDETKYDKEQKVFIVGTI